MTKKKHPRKQSTYRNRDIFHADGSISSGITAVHRQ